MNERKMTDVTAEFERMRAQILLMRVELGLNPGHDLLECVRVLHAKGKDEFERLRGDRCDYAHQWKP